MGGIRRGGGGFLLVAGVAIVDLRFHHDAPGASGVVEHHPHRLHGAAISIANDRNFEGTSP